MAFRPESRWWIVTLLIVGVLMAISALALNRPDVEWDDETPHCPACRESVNWYSSKCAACTAQFDWVVAGDDDSPVSSASLSALEAEELRKTIQAIGIQEAAARVSTHLGMSLLDAQGYLEHLGRGRCGWCGGTGKRIQANDEVPRPEAERSEESAPPCDICQGDGACVGCGGNLRQRMGDYGAHRAATAFDRDFYLLRDASVPDDVQQAEVWRMARDFLRRYSGTEEVSEIVVPYRNPESKLLQFKAPDYLARERLDRVLEALQRAE